MTVLQTGSGMQPAGGKDRTEFTENTQEDLYMALHNAKSSGKTGLGKGRGSGAQHNLITHASNLRSSNDTKHNLAVNEVIRSREPSCGCN